MLTVYWLSRRIFRFETNPSATGEIINKHLYIFSVTLKGRKNLFIYVLQKLACFRRIISLNFSFVTVYLHSIFYQIFAIFYPNFFAIISSSQMSLFFSRASLDIFPPLDHSSGSRGGGPWGSGPPPSLLPRFFKIMQFSGNFKGNPKAPLSKFRWAPPDQNPGSAPEGSPSIYRMLWDFFFLKCWLHKCQKMPN